MSRLVLASASASRKALLSAAGVDFSVAPADLNEPALMDDLVAKGSTADAIAAALAEQKAVMVSRRSAACASAPLVRPDPPVDFRRRLGPGRPGDLAAHSQCPDDGKTVERRLP